VCDAGAALAVAMGALASVRLLALVVPSGVTLYCSCAPAAIATSGNMRRQGTRRGGSLFDAFVQDAPIHAAQGQSWLKVLMHRRAR
jgi:hypothetical protein